MVKRARDSSFLIERLDKVLQEGNGPERGTGKEQDAPRRPPALYNPHTLGKLGLLFTPAFSAYFAKRNWEELGEFAKADEQSRWFRWGVALLVLNVGSYALGYSTVFVVAQIAWLIQIAWWYFKPQAHQRAYVRVRCKDTFEKKSLLAPAALAGILTAALVFAAVSREIDVVTKELQQTGLIAIPDP